jgi:2-polyprenyl-6-methoxyphenol hydroxylase-like FAD-dependent oxidoreductase
MTGSDVLVVGAGPVGLTMAAELARHGCRCRIVDRLDAPSGYCKAIGVTPRTLEIWDDMGVAQRMIDAGLWLIGLRTIVPGQPARDAIVDLSDLPYGNLGLPQYETERILAEHAQRLGVTIEHGMTVSALRDDGRRVGVKLAHARGDVEEAEFRYVVGCDGAHSAVRRAAGIGFPGEAFPMEFMLGDVRVDWDVPRGLAVFAIEPHDDTPPDFVVAVPLPGPSRYRVSMIAPPAPNESGGGEEHGIMADRPGPSLHELQAATDSLLPGKPRLSDLRWSSRFRISMRVADKYRVGNLFIAGDAAHIHPPTGGQGMNTGIQDAYNLAWKMALVLRGAANESLLDSYDAERRPVGVDVVERTKQASIGFGRERKENRLADTQILVNYHDSAWVEDTSTSDGPRAGDRAPDAHGLRRDHVGFPLRLFDLLHGTAHVIIVGLPRNSAPWALDGFAGEWRERYGDLVRMLAIAPHDAPAPELIAVPVVRDSEAAFAGAYPNGEGTAWVIRPDGYIGFRGPLSDRAGLDAYLARILTVRSR